MNTSVMFIVMRLSFMFWLIVADGMFVSRYRRRRRFAARLAISVVVALGISALTGHLWERFAVYAINKGFYNSYTNAIVNLVTHYFLYGVALAGLFFCFDEKPITILFGSIAGYASQNIATTVENIFGKIFPASKFISVNPITPLSVFSYLACNIVTFAVIYFVFARSVGDSADVAEFYSRPTLVLFFVVLVVAVTARSLSVSFGGESILLFVMLGVCGICCCFVILYVQFLLTRSIAEKREKDAILHINELKLKQYEFTKENIDIINLKCHDLKHQLLQLKNKDSIDEKYLDKLSASVLFYDSVFKTGNEALDVVLTDKNLYCVKNDVKLTAIADGEKLSFMDTADIYSLFGNALDNAIDYVMTLPPDKRLVRLCVQATGNIVSISVKNYYEGPILEFVRGLPKTTKKDGAFHGFGVKSMKQIAEAYGGTFAVIADDGQFTVSVLIPRKQSEQ